MSFIFKITSTIAILSAALFAADGYQVSVCPAPNAHKICHNGNPIFLSGMNIAWFNFSQDVGRQGADGGLLYVDESKVRKTFQDLRKAGGNTARWWLYTNNAMDPIFDASNKTSGIELSTPANVKTVLDIAAEYGIVVSICLLSFDMAKKTAYSPNVAEGWSRYNYTANNLMLTDTTYTRAFITKAVLPLVKEFKNHPGLLTWEVFNEPEGMTSTDSFGNGWGTELIDIKYIQRFVNMVADAIHNEAPNNLVSNGSAKTTMTSDIAGTNYYTDARLLASNDGKYAKGVLDFYQVHYYPEWNNNAESPFHHPASYWATNKPLVIGEFPAADWNQAGINAHAGAEDRRMTINEAFDFAYSNGYAGALSWMIYGETPSFYTVPWTLASSAPAMTLLYDKHTSEIKLKDFEVDDNTGKNGVMEVTYTNAGANAQLQYAKNLDLTGATSVSFTVKNTGTEAITYMLVFKTGAADNWGWYQGDGDKCTIEPGNTTTCTVALSSIAQWDDATNSITLHLKQIAETILVSTDPYSGVVYVDNVLTNNKILIHNFDEQYDVFSPSGDEAAAMKATTKYDIDMTVAIKAIKAAFAQAHLLISKNTVQFSTGKTATCFIEVFNIDGKSIATLHRGTLSAGTHSFPMDALSKGLYIVRAQGSGISLNKRLIIQ